MINEREYLARMGDHESVRRLAEFFIDKFLSEGFEGESEEFLNGYREMARWSHQRYLSTVFESSQSEIERIFLSSLVIGFAGNDPLGVMIAGPKDDAPAYVQNTQEAFKAVRDMRVRLSAQGDPRSVTDYCDWLERTGEVDAEEAERWRNIAVVESFMGESFHIIPQATFPELKVGKRGIRTDMLVFVPMRPEVKIVVECDGYQWHGNQETFTTDRKRDRLLRKNGYDVIRYSGPEIVEHPITCAGEFVIDLLEKRHPWITEHPA